MLGPSLGALSGSSWTSKKKFFIPSADPARANPGTWQFAADDPPDHRFHFVTSKTIWNVIINYNQVL